MKLITALAGGVVAFTALTPLSTHAKDRDRDWDRDKHDHHNHDHDRDYRYRRPWFGIGPSYRTTVVYDSGPRYRTYRSIEADVQRALARRGYYYGPVDGDIGPGTSRAIRRYQYSHGLPVTGDIDRYLLRSLGL